jgi:hypothetical protein
VDLDFQGIKEEKRIDKLTLNTGGGVKIVASQTRRRASI